MKKIVELEDFIEAFEKTDIKHNFSSEGLTKLFNHVEQIESADNEEIFFNCKDFCSIYSEFSGVEEFQERYGKEEYPDMESIKKSATVIAELSNKGFVVAH